MSNSEQQLIKVKRVSSFVMVMFILGTAFYGLGMVLGIIGIATSDAVQMTLGNGDFVITAQAQDPPRQASIVTAEPARGWGVHFRFQAGGFGAIGLQTPLTTGLRVLAAVMLFLNAQVMLFVLGQIIRLFELYSKGEIFTQGVVRRFRLIGMGLLGFPVMGLINSLVAAVFIARLAPAADWIDISVDSNVLLLALIVMLVSWIMDVGRELHDETALTI